MANPFSKSKITVATGRKKNLFTSHPQHLTTSEFMCLDVAYSRELAPKSDIKIELSTHARLAAMTLPSYVNVDMHQRSFFVPFRLIQKSWNDFITDTVHTTANNTYGLVTNATTVSNTALVTALTNSLFATQQFQWADNATPPTDAQLSTCDFIVKTGSAAPFVNTAYNFKALGRQFYKVLRQLGYRPIWDDTLNGYGYNVNYSALPLLAYAKVFCDWYFPSQYSNSSIKQDIEMIYNRDNNLSPWISAADVVLIGLNCTKVAYESDYFTAAFDNPVGPNSGNYSSVNILDVTNNRPLTNSHQSPANVSIIDGNPYKPSNGTPSIGIGYSNSLTSSPQITQYILDALKRLTDYSKRHQLSGSVAAQRFLSRFGISLPDTHRSTLISSKVVPMIVGDVMSTAETFGEDGGQNDFGASLGEYAGKGWLEQKDNFVFGYNNDGDFGILLVLTSLVPSIGYFQGINRNLFHINKLDFLTPEFDALGNRAIKACELLVPRDGRTAFSWSSNANDDIFGYTPQFSEYKSDHANHNLTGDFCLNSLNQSGFTSNAWHHFRLIDEDPSNSPVHNYNFVASVDVQQYDRIFQYAPDPKILGIRADHFVINHLFNVELRMPYKSLYDTYDFAEEDENKKVNISTNGVMIN